MVGARYSTYSLEEVSLVMGPGGRARLEINGIDMSCLVELPPPALEAIRDIGRESLSGAGGLSSEGLALLVHLEWLAGTRREDPLAVETCTRAIAFARRALLAHGSSRSRNGPLSSNEKSDETSP